MVKKSYLNVDINLGYGITVPVTWQWDSTGFARNINPVATESTVTDASKGDLQIAHTIPRRFTYALIFLMFKMVD
jgi:hypothetical protein